MSEYPIDNVTSLSERRQGSPLDENTDLALKMSNLPYDREALAKVHQLDAARKAREAAIAAERDAQQSGPELAGADLTRLTAVRNAVLNEQIGIAS